MTQGILAKARSLGFDPVGVCRAYPPDSIGKFKEWVEGGKHGTMDYLARSVEHRADPASLLPGVRSVVAVGLNYNQPNPPIRGMPRIARYALGRDYHKTVRGKLKRLQQAVQELCPGAVCRPCVDSAPILEREFAQRAGLGWFGKNTCLIDSKRGSWFVIGLLLTTAELDPSPAAAGGCGTCRLCVEACPTGAIVFEGERWQVDARTCVSYLTIEHKGGVPVGLEAQVGDWTFGCDVCQEVCPFNQPRATQPLRAATTSEPDFLNRRQWPNLLELAVVQPDEWDHMTQGSPVRRAGLTGLRRNASVNLVNQAKESNAGPGAGDAPTGEEAP